MTPEETIASNGVPENSAENTPSKEETRTYQLENTQLKGKSKTYQLEKYLGLGLTAEVYRAACIEDNQTVAVKVLRSDAAPLTQEYFWSEGLMVGELIASGASGIPRKLDEQREGDPPHFLVFEYVDHDQFQPITDRLEKGPLPEQETLEIAIQALAVLDILHNKVGRTYTDMQLRNFWWDAQTRSLRVMDWNHVSRKREEIDNIGKIEDPDLRRKREEELAKLGARNFNDLIANDLGRLASFIYQMLTGKGASPRGETQRDLETRAGETWQSISLAARQALRQALHPNLQMRFASAAGLSAALQQVQKLWDWQEGDAEAYLKLINQTAENAEKAQPGSPEELQDIDRAYALLDMIERQEAGFKVPRERARRKLDEATQRVSQEWGRGINLFNGDQFLAAYGILKDEAASLGRLDLWRWVLLIKAGADQTTLLKRDSPDRQIFLDALQEMNQGDFQKAQARLLTQKTTRTTTLQILEGEIRTQLNAARARLLADSSRPDDWGNAAGLLRQVEEWLVSSAGDWPEYVRLLRSEAGWQNLVDEARLLEDRLATLNASKNTLDKITALWPEQFTAGLSELQQALRSAPESPDLLRLCLEPPLSDPEQVQQVVEAGVLLGSHPEYSPRLRQKLAEMRAQKQQQARRQAFEQTLQELEQAVEQGPKSKLPELILRLPDDPELRQGERFQSLLKRAGGIFDILAQQFNLPAMRQFDQVLHALGAPGAEQRQAAIHKTSETLKDEMGLLERRNNEIAAIEAERNKLAHEQRLYEFRQWRDANPLQNTADYERLIKEAEEKFPDLANMKAADGSSGQNQKDNLETWKEELEKERLRLEAIEAVSGPIHQAGDILRQLDRAKFAQAKELLKSVEKRLKDVGDKSKIGNIQEMFENHQTWLAELENSKLPEEFSAAQQAFQEYEQALEQNFKTSNKEAAGVQPTPETPLLPLLADAWNHLELAEKLSELDETKWAGKLEISGSLYPAIPVLKGKIVHQRMILFGHEKKALHDIIRRMSEEKRELDSFFVSPGPDGQVIIQFNPTDVSSAPSSKSPTSASPSSPDSGAASPQSPASPTIGSTESPESFPNVSEQLDRMHGLEKVQHPKEPPAPDSKDDQAAKEPKTQPISDKSGFQLSGWPLAISLLIAMFLLVGMSSLIGFGVKSALSNKRIANLETQIGILQPNAITATLPTQPTQVSITPTLTPTATAAPLTDSDSTSPETTPPTEAPTATITPTPISTDLQVKIAAGLYNLPVVITVTNSLTNTYYFDLPPLILISSPPSETLFGLVNPDSEGGLKLQNAKGDFVDLQLMAYLEDSTDGIPQAMLAQPGPPGEYLTIYLEPDPQNAPLAAGNYRLALEYKQKPGQALWENRISVIAAETTLKITEKFDAVLFPSINNPKTITSLARSSPDEIAGITSETIFEVIGKTIGLLSVQGQEDKTVIRWLLLRRKDSRQLFWGYYVISPGRFALSRTEKIVFSDYWIPTLEERSVGIP